MAVIICSSLVYWPWLSTENGRSPQNRYILRIANSRSILQTDDNSSCGKIIEGETWSETFYRYVRIFSPNSDQLNDDRWPSIDMERYRRCWPNKCVFIRRGIVWFNQVLIKNFYREDVSMLYNRLSFFDKVRMGDCEYDDGCITKWKM